MKFANCWRKLLTEPWCITPLMHRTMTDILVQHMRGEKPAAFFMLDDSEETAPAMILDDGVAIIPVKGVISKDVSKMEKMSGAIDVREIGEMIDAALSDPRTTAIVLNVDSPGGSITGVPELAAKVAEANKSKPVFAYTDGMMASAAYWISAGASAIYAAGSAVVGSIGCYLALLDESRAYELAGYRTEVIKAKGSPMKAAGLPGTSLTDEQRIELQEGVDHVYGQFRDFVLQSRAVPDEAMRGGTYFGTECGPTGLIDSISTLENCVNDARDYATKRMKK